MPTQVEPEAAQVRETKYCVVLPSTGNKKGFSFSFQASLTAYGNSQARGHIGAAASGLYHNYSNVGSKPHLQPTPQIKPASSWTLVGFVNH